MLRSRWLRYADRRVALEELPEPVCEFSAPDDTLTRAILALPDGLRQAVTLRYYQGLTASGERRVRIRVAVMQNRREEKPVKNKKTLIVAIALVALVLTSALVVAERMNLFDFFGQYDARYAELAPSAMLEISEPVLLEISEPVLLEHPQLGDVTAQIDSAYYDGKNLMLAYRISNCARAEVYTPHGGGDRSHGAGFHRSLRPGGQRTRP